MTAAFDHSEVTHQRARIGTMQGIVANTLIEDLCSLNPLVESGHSVVLHSQGGNITHNSTGRSVSLRRDGLRWKVMLSDLVDLTVRTTQSQADSNTIPTAVSLYSGTITKLNASERMAIIELHERMGHPDVGAMCKAISGQRPSWKTKLPINPAQLRKVFREYECVHCVLAKRNIEGPQDLEGRNAAMFSGELIAGDPVGPIHPPTRDGHIWFFLFKCLKTGMPHVYTGKTRDGFYTAFEQVVSYYHARGHRPRILRSDNDTVIDCAEMQAFLVKHQMIHQHSPRIGISRTGE